MTIHIQHADIHLIDLQTRLPFKYGIATMTSAPHAFVRVEADINGRRFFGVAADHLPPKWFTKIAEKPLDEEIDEMLQTIEHAVAACIGLRGDSAYDVWRQLDEAQSSWGREKSFPPLLSNFGTSLVERALIESAAKSAGQSFAAVVRNNLLGIRLGEMDDRLTDRPPADFLPSQPRRRVTSRQTIGMADPLTSGEIAAGERLDDGLPQSLDELIQRYGLRHFKIKVFGDVKRDLDRIQRVARVLTEHAGSDFAFTMDGNEQFRSLEEFRSYWDTIVRSESLRSFFERLLFVEQPFHRDVALDETVLGELNRWTERPKLIIDESDAEHDSLSRALRLGYHGTSHKNCKGVFRSIAHACLLEKLRRDEPDRTYLLSGEDLATIGPVSLLQDLAVGASLGISSIERNGHHYFAGLSAFPAKVQQQVLEAHGDLYHPSSTGWPTLCIQQGELDLGSIVDAPLGVGFELDPELFTPVAEWRRTSPMSLECRPGAS